MVTDHIKYWQPLTYYCTTYSETDALSLPTDHVINTLKPHTHTVVTYRYDNCECEQEAGQYRLSADSKPALCLRPATRHTCPPRPPAHLLPAKLRALPSPHTFASSCTTPSSRVCLLSVISLLLMYFINANTWGKFSSIFFCWSYLLITSVK